MSDVVFDAVLRRQLADARAAIVELSSMCLELDEDPLDDPTAYVTSPVAKDAVTAALALADRLPTDPDRSTVTFEDLRDQLLTDGVRLEKEALEMSGPDYQTAHQGRGLGMQVAAIRITDLLRRQAELEERCAS